MDNFEYCRNFQLTVLDILLTLSVDVDSDDCYARHGDRYMQMLGDWRIRISCPLSEFDRWAVSADYDLDTRMDEERKILVDFIEKGILPELPCDEE